MFLNSKGWQLLSHRKVVGFVEIDLVFKTPKGQMVLVEVKSSSKGFFSTFRWQRDQKNKFLKVLESLTIKYPQTEIYGVLAFVDYNKLSFFYMDEL